MRVNFLSVSKIILLCSIIFSLLCSNAQTRSNVKMFIYELEKMEWSYDKPEDNLVEVGADERYLFRFPSSSKEYYINVFVYDEHGNKSDFNLSYTDMTLIDSNNSFAIIRSNKCSYFINIQNKSKTPIKIVFEVRAIPDESKTKASIYAGKDFLILNTGSQSSNNNSSSIVGQSSYSTPQIEHVAFSDENGSITIFGADEPIRF